MITNCLVSKFKDSVNNDNLQYFGKLTIKVSSVDNPTATSQRLYLGTGYSIETLDGSAKISINSDFSNPVNKIDNVTGNGRIYLVNGTYTLLVNRYDYQAFVDHIDGNYSIPVSYSLDVNDLKCARKMNGVTGIMVVGNTVAIKDFDISNVITSSLSEVCYLSTSKVIGNIACFELVSINYYHTLGINLRNTNCYGDAGVFGRFKNVVQINISGSNRITGTLESICNGMVSEGRVSGILTFTSNNKVTYKGNNIGGHAQKTIRFGSSMVNPTEEDTARGYQVTSA